MQIPNAFVSEHPNTCSDPDKGRKRMLWVCQGPGPRTLSRDWKLKLESFFQALLTPLPDTRNGASGQPEAAQDRDPGNGCGNERGPEAGVQEAEKGSEDVGRAYPESF